MLNIKGFIIFEKAELRRTLEYYSAVTLEGEKRPLAELKGPNRQRKYEQNDQ